MSSQSSTPPSNETTKSGSRVGLYVTIGIGSLAIGCSLAAIPFLTPAMRKHALPYIPATPKQIGNVFQSVRAYGRAHNTSAFDVLKQPAVRLVDLGSGDGRIVFEAASRGFVATGVELNAVLCVYSTLKALLTTGWRKPTTTTSDQALLAEAKSYLIQRPRFRRADFWRVDMSEYDVIVVFGVQEMMKDLGDKLRSEMKANSLIVSCRNPIPSYKSVYTIEDDMDSVWIYNTQSLFELVEQDEKLVQRKRTQQEKEDDDDEDTL